MNAPLPSRKPSPKPLLFDLEELLAPLPGADPTGPSLRYERSMTEIRRAREADDPSLPMGEWDRPLKKADWPVVVLLGTRLLAERSKDLQLAAWLTEAWVHLHDLDGLVAGISLLVGLVERHWDGVHPRIDDDGDCDARIAPLVWLNENLPMTLRLQISLTEWPERRPPRITLEDWDQSLRVRADEDPSDRSPPPGELPPLLPTRDELLNGHRGPTLAQLRHRRQQVLNAAGEWARLRSVLDERLGPDGPSLGRVAETLILIERALNQLIAARPATEQAADDAPAAVRPDARAHRDAALPESPLMNDHDPRHDGVDHGDLPDADRLDRIADRLTHGLLDQAEPASAGAVGAAPMVERTPGPLASRRQAYRLLSEVADYLQRLEPHSPTPYLIRRAVRWGELPLPALMQEMMREEGDLQPLLKLLAVQPAEH